MKFIFNAETKNINKLSIGKAKNSYFLRHTLKVVFNPESAKKYV